MKSIVSKSFLLIVFNLVFCYEVLAQQAKYALVIGVRSYKYVAPLQNSLNDARDMSATLKAKGFTVIEVFEPANKRVMQEGIIRYFKMLQGQPNAAGLVFYSGHGMQVKGVNYLIPTDANPAIEADLDDQCVNMDYVMRAIQEAGNGLNIFILDACRNNPFRSFSRSSEKGLSMVDTPQGSYIVYATKPGSVASDGTGRNGLFTSKLLQYINTEGLNIEQVFKQVARDVAAESSNEQRPWIASDYTGDFYFSGAGNATIAKPINSKPTETDVDLFAKGKQFYDQKNYADAYIFLERAAMQGNADGQAYLGILYDYGRGVIKNYEEAVKWYTKAAEQGNAAGQGGLGWMYCNGQGVAQNYVEALKWFRKAAAQGNRDGQSGLGYMYSEGIGVAQNYTEAVAWYTKAAEQGEMNAQVSLGHFFSESVGVAQNYTEALKWYTQAAEQGEANAQVSLGNMFYAGTGVAQNYTEALKWYTQAAEQGEVNALITLGFMFESGQGIAQNCTEAIKRHTQAAEQGSARGQTILGYKYLKGECVAQNHFEAVKWFVKAAHQGFSIGQVYLGNMYRDGTGITQSYEEAVNWYRKAAEQGDSGGQNNLGYMYKYGLGVTKSKTEARKWYQLAADQGHEVAKENLKKL